jgi:hypothetical protein
VAATDVGALAVIAIVQQQDHWRRNEAQTDFTALENCSLEVQARRCAEVHSSVSQ